jgi:hypothetical protein
MPVYGQNDSLYRRRNRDGNESGCCTLLESLKWCPYSLCSIWLFLHAQNWKFIGRMFSRIWFACRNAAFVGLFYYAFFTDHERIMHMLFLPIHIFRLRIGWTVFFTNFGIVDLDYIWLGKFSRGLYWYTRIITSNLLDGALEKLIVAQPLRMFPLLLESEGSFRGQDKNVAAATNTHATIEELFHASFSMRSVSYQMKVGD